jgi:hypothetical protein
VLHVRRRTPLLLLTTPILAALLSSCTSTEGALKAPECGGKTPTVRTVTAAQELPLPQVETDGSPIFVKAFEVDTNFGLGDKVGEIFAGPSDVAPDVLARGNVNNPTITIQAVYGKWYPLQLTAGVWWLMERKTNGFQLAWCNADAVKNAPDLAAPLSPKA